MKSLAKPCPILSYMISESSKTIDANGLNKRHGDVSG